LVTCKSPSLASIHIVYASSLICCSSWYYKLSCHD